MDNRANLHEPLFSRNSNSTPPTSPPQLHAFPQQSHAANNSTPSLIDALFQGMSVPASNVEHNSPQGSLHEPHPVDSYHEPAGVTSVTEETPMSPSSIADRQNSLLSLIGAPMAGRPQPAPQSIQSIQNVQQQPSQLQQQPQQVQQPQPIPQSQQVPTPPSSSQRSNVSPPQSDTQKMLENIISGGSTSRSTNYSDTPRNNQQQQQAPSPPYSQREDYRNFNQYEQVSDSSPRSRNIPNPNVPPQPPQPQQVQPPSPRRSMFEFTSPFDHLSNTSIAVKKKPVPTPPSSMPSASEEAAWSPPAIDPKRQSVDNLLETLTRGQPLVSQLPQPPAYESYLSGADFGDMDQASSRGALPPIPGTKAASIPSRGSSPRERERDALPKAQTIHRPQPRPVDSGISQVSFTSGLPYPPGTRVEEKGSPLRNNKALKPQQAPAPQQTQIQPQPQPKYTKPAPASNNFAGQNIVFDVSQGLEEVQARDCVKWTPIALVKQDPVFLPGTTIGATHWVAYAMTRGRVRVISRSSGDRTLLQLPQVFSMSASVIDMAVFNNRLAGVTSDGGFVVWELPDIITDDVPGRILLCVPPTNDPRDAIRGVKWHSKEVDTVAIASDDKVFVIDLANTHPLHGQPLPHSELHHLGQRFEVHSPIVAFDFDVAHNAIATITEDANLAIWNMQDTLPYSVQKIRGDDIPSSLTFVDGGIVIGRRNGTIFQLLSASTKAVLSTITFVNGTQDDVDMFGHAVYDTRIQTLWIANSRRESLIALKLHVDPNYAHDDGGRGYVEQVAEFAGIKPTIHFVILTADADPHGDEAHAACIAAKIQPGELALVGFSVHSTGVDQVLIRREKFDDALLQLQHTGSRFPAHDPSLITPTNVLGLENKARQPLPAVPQNAPVPQSSAGLYSSIRGHSPTPAEAENEFSEGRASDNARSKGSKHSKGNSNWKDSDDQGKEKNAKPGDAAIINDSSLGQALSREIRKTEENLHIRIGKLIGKEMDKQHARFEEARLHDQAEDFSRQEKILKLISNELTRNTTRVVEMAVKNEVQNSVLPSLENITRNEVKAALNDQIGVSMVDVITRTLPVEIEKLVLRPSVANHFTNILSSALAPVLEHHIKEILSTTFFQMHANQTAAMQQDLMRELRIETSNIKGEFTQWHNEALRAQEGTIREMRDTIRALSDQVKFLSSLPNVPPTVQHIPQPPPQQNIGPSLPPPQQSNNMGMRQPLPNNNPPIPSYMHNQPHSFQQQAPPPPQQQPPPPHHIQQQQQWYTALAAPQASVPATLPQAPPSQPQELTPPPKTEQWDENYLSILHSQDPAKLRDVLQRTNPDLVFPINGTPLVSQAVILTLIHRLSAVLGESVATDETFKSSLWWLQRVCTLLRPDDKLIADFIPRVIPTVQQSLNTTKQRLAILPGGAGMMDTVRALSDVQEALRRKVGQQ